MHKRRSLLSSTALLLLGSGLIFVSLCVEAIRANEYADFEGTWRSKGYGYILDITASGVTAYDVIPTSCIPNPEMAEIFGAYLILSKVNTNANRSRLALSLPLDQYEYVFERQDNLPAQCNVPAQYNADLYENFEVFVSYFTTHYASFETHNVDWEATVAAARAQLDDISTPLALFALFKNMLKGLRDPHIQMQAIIDNEEHYFVGNARATAHRLAVRDELDDGKALDELIGRYWMDNIPKKILAEQGMVDGNGYIQYGTSSQIGYIAILAEGDYVGKGAYHDREDYEKLNQVLDDAHALFT